MNGHESFMMPTYNDNDVDDVSQTWMWKYWFSAWITWLARFDNNYSYGSWDSILMEIIADIDKI